MIKEPKKEMANSLDNITISSNETKVTKPFDAVNIKYSNNDQYKLNLKDRLRIHFKPLLQGFGSGALLIVIVALAVYSYGVISNDNYTNGGVYSVWQIGLIITAILSGIIVSIGLPILWGKPYGFSRVLKIISMEVLLFALILLISGIVINIQSNDNGYPGTGPICNSVNGALCSGVNNCSGCSTN